MKIRRVAKVVKGGRNLSFSAMMVVGDREGRVGAALGKAASIPDATQKGRQRAEKGMTEVVRRDATIPHEVKAKYGSAKVVLLPATPGTGVIAGGGVRAVIEAAGIEDVLSKTYGGNNAVNTVRATLKALSLLRDPRVEISRRLGNRENAAESVVAENESSVEEASTPVSAKDSASILNPQTTDD